jgi:DNA-binding CsgD family transcriptional regulator
VFFAAGGVAMCLLELGDVDAAGRWLDKAAAAISTAPSPSRSIQLETWHGRVRAGAGDAEGMRSHLDKAVAIATEAGQASARCDALARLAVEAARLVATDATNGGPDPAIVELVERSAAHVKDAMPLLPGHAPWGAQADAALATVALGRGDTEGAAMLGGAALQALDAAHHEDTSLEILIPAARAVLAGAPSEFQDFVRTYVRTTLSRIAQGIADESIRVRWLTGPLGRELVALAGPLDGGGPRTSADGASASAADAQVSTLDDMERRLLQLLTEGRTNAEIAAELDIAEEEVGHDLARLFAQLGTSSRAEATSLAFRGLAAVGSH